MGLVHSVKMGGYLVNTFNIFILGVNATVFIVAFFFISIVIASRICKRFFIVIFIYDCCIVN